MKFGIYGGTFDPVHHGHLILARDACERFNLDRMIFVPCSQSPHKNVAPRASGRDRLRMLRLAIKDEPSFGVSDIEVRRGGISYAIETVEGLHLQYPEAKWCWLIGADQVKDLATWRDYARLRRMVKFLVMERPGVAGVRSALGRHISISASEVRMRIVQGRSIRYLVPDPVMRYIHRRHLFATL
jgi:nicotinate-nucleotide adenylyltransferase